MSGWTVAYRRLLPEPEPVFHRVELDLTWEEASSGVAANYRDTLGDDYEVWWTSTRALELTEGVAREDVLNILTDDGTRIPIADDGRPLDELG